MPKFTTALSQATVTNLNKIVARTNENAGTALTLQQWITLHLQELAISDDLTAAITALQHQQQADAQTALDTAITAARDELLAGLK